MSSRALRRLHREADVIRLGDNESGSEDGEEENPVFQPQNKKKGRSKGFVKAVQDPFELLAGDDEEEIEEEKEEDEEQSVTAATASSVTTKQKRRKKKKKKGKREQTIDTRKEEVGGMDEVDAAVKEVNEMLGELDAGGVGERDEPPGESLLPHHILIVDRRFLSAENEMRRIFGSRVVREHTQRRTHRQRYQRPTILATPTDSWPKMEKLGLSMQLVEVKNGCSFFVFQHSSEYQKVQFSFWDAVETYDPNSIAAVLHAHPYHIDSLLQLSEVCKMGDDTQMAADLIERALYSFETIFHPLFNYTQANCRLDYNQAENRSFYLTLFRHLNYIGRKGCHRTAFEFCKLLLSLNPDKDPMCALLLIDYFAVRSCEYDFLINLYKLWEPHRNLSQLPNFAFSVPLAMFHCSGKRKDEEEMVQAADKHLQNALIMFPSILLPLMDKCGVMLDPVVMTHAHFTGRSSSRDPEALQLLTKLYIERAHSLWKEPEVLTWLEANARVVVTRANSCDPLIEQCDTKRKVRYVGTPRNIYRHVIVSDLESVTGSLPRDITGTPIMMYDPLPPESSTAAYKRPPRTQSTLGENENSLSLFLRSLLPSFTTTGDTRGQVQAEGLPQPQQQQPAEGAVGGDGVNLEAAVGQLTQSLRGLLDQLRVALERPLDEDEIEQDSGDDDDR